MYLVLIATTVANSTIDKIKWRAAVYDEGALHYAHEFYGEGRDRKIGGLTFPGDDDPDYWDFLYYSLVIAMTAQVSDVQISSRTIRWSTTFHAIVSFFFNVAILALGVNIASNLLQGSH